MLGFKGRHTDKSIPFIWGKVGADLFRKIHKVVHLERTFDKDNDQYKEEIIDKSTGEVLHRCDEPLSKHQGHGSAKNLNKIT